MLDRLKTGEVPWVKLRPLAEEVRGIYPSLKDLKEYICEVPELFVEDTIAISVPWLSKLQDECLKLLHKDDLVDLKVSAEFSYTVSLRRRLLVVPSIYHTIILFVRLILH